MRKFLFTIFSFLSSFILICDVNAVSNINDFSHLTIADSGAIYNNSNDSGYNSVGYVIDEASFGTESTGQPYSFVTTTSNLQTVLNGYGASISQCGFNFQQNHNYSLTFYFMSDEYNDIKYSLDHTKKTYKLGISNSPTGYTSFNALSSESGVNNYVNKPYYVSWYSIVFKAPSSGSCITSAFSTSPTYTHTTSGNMFMYLGYFYDYLGEGNLTADEIQHALENSFNNVTNNINNSINSATSQINSNIDELKAKQDEQNETSKGIWGSLKEGIANIGKWFTSLGESIGNFFADLKNAIIDSIMGKEVCHDVSSTEEQEVQPVNLVSKSDFTLNGSYYMTDFIPVSKDKKYIYWNFYDYVPSSNNDILVYDDNKSNEYSFFSPGQRAYDQNGKQSEFLFLPTSRVSYIRLKIKSSGFNNYEPKVYLGDDFGCTYPHTEEVEVTKPTCEREGGILGALSNLVKSIGKWFSDLTKSIGNFFSDLLNGIIEGLKALFVPTDEQLLEIIDASKDLSENFGFIGEAISFFITIFTSLLGLVNANGCVELPAFKMGATSLFKEHTFWEAQTVCLSDNVILSNNIDTIRAVTSIALVCMFITFAASKFFSILSKNDNERASDDADMVRSGY